jgi:ATP-dependent helicase Lhr and Lhr-like helicase
MTDPILEFLSVLERRENALLSWGVVEGGFKEDELFDVAADWLESQGDLLLTPDEVLEQLVELRLLFPLADGEHYRTRMAHAVRLMSRLRQVFAGGKTAWRTAPNLVADYRIIMRPRRYPVRQLDAAAVRLRLGELGVMLDPGDADVLDALIGSWELARFQVDATARVLEHVGQDVATATIACAGTGSGKTLAFYLPAILDIAANLGSPRTRCLAIYPRNELLKDQLTEAFRRVRLVDSVLAARGNRKLTIGALYGAVPRNARAVVHPPKHGPVWQRASGIDGYLCPHLRCPDRACSSEMVWLDRDLATNSERLVCSSCGAVVGPDEFVLTRDRLQKEPPDILFTNTEMPNRHMCDRKMARIFGVGSDVKPPRLVLLDEVHTYEGVHGAQVAYLMRRWRHLSHANPHYVGLSATLADAERFFADIIGLYPERVMEVSPTPDQMQEEGMEYMLALRGDPVSGTSLLSTSIQAAMLLRRVLEPASGARAGGAFGSKVFAFSDDLDVTNRFFHTLLDAEGWSNVGQPSVRPLGSLANLRASGRPQATERDRNGQNWQLCEWIGHDLVDGSRTPLGRTSSQDIGVDPLAEVVVATASLEVGIDDDAVGAILQHKAPHSAAAFLQRMGRAGRQRGMRPWTIVVLSDYGRDRQTYHAYEQLFSPNLTPRYLPLKNRYVQRIQAGYAVMEWLGRKASRNLWMLMARPAEDSGPDFLDWAKRLQDELAGWLERVLDDPSVRDDLALHVRATLSLSEEECKAVLWDPPRAILASVVPTLLRRLHRQWTTADGGTEHYGKHPLPEFVPSTLFQDLNLPEVEVVLPRADPEMVPIAKALREFAPGRVSRRFGIRHASVAHWVAAPGTDSVDVDAICPPEAQQWLGRFEMLDADGIHRTVPCIRPYALRVEQVPREVSTTSNATPLWRTQIIPPGSGRKVDIPPGRWETLFEDIHVFTHDRADPIEIRRFTVETEYAIRITGQDEIRGLCRYSRMTDGERRAVALGFVADVDAAVFRIRVPDDLRARLVREHPELVRSLRPALFTQRMLDDPQLQAIANSFRIRWLAQVYLSAVTCEAVLQDSTIEAAHDTVMANTATVPLGNVLDVIFQSIEVPGGEDEEARVHRQLREALTDDHVIEALARHGPTLWQTPDRTWDGWLAERFVATFGAALSQAARHLCPQLDLGDLVVDLDTGPQHDPGAFVEIWLSESRVGGSGFISSLRDRITGDPRLFFEVLETVLGPTDSERVDVELTQLIDAVQTDGTVAAAFDDVRKAYQSTYEELGRAISGLHRLMVERGHLVSHVVTTSLHARVLKPGSASTTDELLRNYLHEWDAQETRCGVEIDSRVFAYACSMRSDLDDALVHLSTPPASGGRETWRFSVLNGLFWPRGAAVLGTSLQAWNPFVSLPTPDRRLALAGLEREITIVDVREPAWEERIATALGRDGEAGLSAELQDLQQLKEATLSLMVNPIDIGHLLVHPRSAGVRRIGTRTVSVFRIPEAPQ